MVKIVRNAVFIIFHGNTERVYDHLTDLRHGHISLTATTKVLAVLRVIGTVGSKQEMSLETQQS